MWNNGDTLPILVDVTQLKAVTHSQMQLIRRLNTDSAANVTPNRKYDLDNDDKISSHITAEKGFYSIVWVSDIFNNTNNSNIHVFRGGAVKPRLHITLLAVSAFIPLLCRDLFEIIHRRPISMIYPIPVFTISNYVIEIHRRRVTQRLLELNLPSFDQPTHWWMSTLSCCCVWCNNLILGFW